MTYPQITLEERYHLYALRVAGVSRTGMARALGRHRSTIYRELRRNRCSDGPYRPYQAHTRTRARRSHARRNRRLTAATWRQVTRLLRLELLPPHPHRLLTTWKHRLHRPEKVLCK